MKNNRTLIAYITPVIHFLFCVLLVAIPISKAVASIAVVSLLLLSLIKLKEEGLWHLIRKYKAISIIGLLLIAYSLGLAHTANLNKGLDMLIVQHSFITVPIIALLNRKLIAQRFEKYLSYYIIGTVTGSICTLLFYLLPTSTSQQIATTLTFLQPYNVDINRELFGLYSPFIDRLNFSYLIALAILAQCWLFTRQKVSLPSIVGFFILIIATLLLGGRGGQLGLLGALFIWALAMSGRHIYPILKKKTNKYVAMGIIVSSLLIGSISIPYTAFQTIPTLQNRYQQLFFEIDVLSKNKQEKYNFNHFTSLRRITSWYYNWLLIKEHPVWGVGTGDYKDEMLAIYEKNQLKVAVNMHNQLLFVWLCTGIFGAIAFIFMKVYWLWSIVRRADWWLATFAISFISFFCIIMLADTPLITQIGSMIFSLFSCLIAVKALVKHESKNGSLPYFTGYSNTAA